MSFDVSLVSVSILGGILYLIFGGMQFNKFYSKILGWNLISKNVNPELSNHFIGSNSEVTEEMKLFLSFFYYLFLWPIEFLNFTPKNNKFDSNTFDLYWNRCKLDRKAFIGTVLFVSSLISVPSYFTYKAVERSSTEKESKVLALGKEWSSFYNAMDINNLSKSESVIDSCDFSEYRNLSPSEMSFVLEKVPDSWMYSCQKKFIKKYQESRK